MLSLTTYSRLYKKLEMNIDLYISQDIIPTIYMFPKTLKTCNTKTGQMGFDNEWNLKMAQNLLNEVTQIKNSLLPHDVNILEVLHRLNHKFITNTLGCKK